MPASCHGVPSATRMNDSIAAGMSSGGHDAARPEPAVAHLDAAVVGGAQPSGLVDRRVGIRVVPRREAGMRASRHRRPESPRPNSANDRLGGIQQGKRGGEHAVLELRRRQACRAVGRAGSHTRGPGAVRCWSICLRIDPSATVAIPSASKTWASVLTVRVQSGQTGVNRTTSTPCSRNHFAPAGPESMRMAARSNWLPA